MKQQKWNDKKWNNKTEKTKNETTINVNSQWWCFGVDTWLKPNLH